MVSFCIGKSMNERKNPLIEALGGIDEELIEESTLRLYGNDYYTLMSINKKKDLIE